MNLLQEPAPSNGIPVGIILLIVIMVGLFIGVWQLSRYLARKRNRNEGTGVDSESTT